jgi:hypothetical protein
VNAENQDSAKPRNTSETSGSLIVVGILNMMFGLAVGGCFGIFGISLLFSYFSKISRILPGLTLLAMAITGGLQVVASIGMFSGRQKSVEFADLLARLFLITLPVSILLMAIGDTLAKVDWMAVGGPFVMFVLWPIIVIAFAARRRSHIAATERHSRDKQAFDSLAALQQNEPQKSSLADARAADSEPEKSPPQQSNTISPTKRVDDIN